MEKAKKHPLKQEGSLAPRRARESVVDSESPVLEVILLFRFESLVPLPLGFSLHQFYSVFTGICECVMGFVFFGNGKCNILCTKAKQV